jgi:hypothetical protein
MVNGKGRKEAQQQKLWKQKREEEEMTAKPSKGCPQT